MPRAEGSTPIRWHRVADEARAALTTHSVLDVNTATTVSGTSRPSTYQAIDALTEAGILREVTGGATRRIWIGDDVMAELSELEERIGLRSRPTKLRS